MQNGSKTEATRKQTLRQDLVRTSYISIYIYIYIYLCMYVCMYAMFRLLLWVPVHCRVFLQRCIVFAVGVSAPALAGWSSSGVAALWVLVTRLSLSRMQWLEPRLGTDEPEAAARIRGLFGSLLFAAVLSAWCEGKAYVLASRLHMWLLPSSRGPSKKNTKTQCAYVGPGPWPM